MLGHLSHDIRISFLCLPESHAEKIDASNERERRKRGPRRHHPRRQRRLGRAAPLVLKRILAHSRRNRRISSLDWRTYMLCIVTNSNGSFGFGKRAESAASQFPEDSEADAHAQEGHGHKHGGGRRATHRPHFRKTNN